MNQVYLSIIIPAYNEEKRIQKTLSYIFTFLSSKKTSFEIIVVANNCTDNTISLLNQIKHKTIPELVIIDIPKTGTVGNMKGYAIKKGMNQACGQYHIFIDADNATPFEQVFDFIKYIDQGYDVVIGSRYVVGSNVVKKQPLYRVMISRLGNIITRLLLIPGIYDTQCGFKMFSSKASNIIFSRTILNGWGTDLEMLAIARVFKLKIKEAPVRWIAQDESSVRSHAFLKTFGELLKVRKMVKNHFYEK